MSFCIGQPGTFTLRNFQGNVLDISGAIGPLVSFPQSNPAGDNQRFEWKSTESGWTLTAPTLSGAVYYNPVFDPSEPSTVGPQFMQLFVANAGTNKGFNANCVNSTAGRRAEPYFLFSRDKLDLTFPNTSFFLGGDTLALTAWPAESDDGAAPNVLQGATKLTTGCSKVTLETYTGRLEQIWSVVLD
ncbi:hypothetical protein GGX14DRAFT_405775 [Mycena pura]|uniref:Ricin B lectin domain-containing protein n=1 Tax=Mycena pura TaxID=153505 RepID=A0AAD6Y277_9AGAR|nr:hypothetical protein GGX14DRAFT_405775 [Mycena pura]